MVAIAGPLVNVAIAALLILLFGADFAPERMGDIQKVGTDFATRLALVNIALVLFNLLPAFPMDGGRILRAILSVRLDRIRATRIAAGIGQIVAFGLGFLGLFGNPLLVFIAIFIFIAASQETYASAMSEAAQGASMLQATITSFEKLDTGATVRTAAAALLATTQTEFPVTDGAGRLRGVLTRDGIVRALSTTGPETPVIDVMERDIKVLNRRAPLSEAMTELQKGGNRMLGVVDDDGRVVGIVTVENLGEYMLIHQAEQGFRQVLKRRPT
jgi:hypothetical protein